MAPGSAAAFLRGCATLPPLASPSLCVALLTLAVAAAFFVIAPPHSAGLAAQTPTLTSAPDVATAPAHDDELAELMRSAAAFGAPSSVSCSGEAEHASCAFSNLYLVAGRLRFLLADTGGDGEDDRMMIPIEREDFSPPLKLRRDGGNVVDQIVNP